MTTLESRLRCPVCLGSTLQKSVVVEKPDTLTIDHCVRCGGVWFDYGEVQQLRRCEPRVLWELVAQHTHVHQMQCHGCSAHVNRNDEKCAGCGRQNLLECPSCSRAMHVESYQGMRLDACVDCKGVWFDRHELSSIWRMEMNALLRTRKRTMGENAKDGGVVLLDALAWDPWLTFYGVHALSEGVSLGGNAIAGAGEVAGGIGEVIADAAGSVFETIADIIGGIFG